MTVSARATRFALAESTELLFHNPQTALLTMLYQRRSKRDNLYLPKNLFISA